MVWRITFLIYYSCLNISRVFMVWSPQCFSRLFHQAQGATQPWESLGLGLADCLLCKWWQVQLPTWPTSGPHFWAFPALLITSALSLGSSQLSQLLYFLTPSVSDQWPESHSPQGSGRPEPHTLSELQHSTNPKCESSMLTSLPAVRTTHPGSRQGMWLMHEAGGPVLYQCCAASCSQLSRHQCQPSALHPRKATGNVWALTHYAAYPDAKW